MSEDLGSDTREAVWSMPKRSRAVIALGNNSDTFIQTTAQFSDGETDVVKIAPFATEFVRRSAHERQGNDASSDSVKLTTVGPPGSLTVAGFVLGGEQDFNGSIRFADTKKVAQPNLYATNLRLDNTRPRMLIENTGDSGVSARPKFFSATGAQGNPIELPEIILAPRQIVDVDLRPLTEAATSRTDLNFVSAEVLNSGAPGSLIGALYGTDKVKRLSYDVPLRDSGPMRSSTGSYPWRVDDDYTTIVNITNISDHFASFIVDIRYPSGHYFLPAKDLAANGTSTFDLRKLISDQKPDNQGNVIPLSITGGQFHWSIFGSPPSSKFIGRSEVVSVSDHVSSSYSCPACCPESGPFGDIIPPDPMVVNGSSQVNTIGAYYDCNGYPTNIGGLPIEQWSMDDLSIAAPIPPWGSSTQLYGISGGETFITGVYSWDQWDLVDGWSQCNESRGQNYVGAGVDVFDVRILRDGTDITGQTANVIVGQRIDLALQAVPSGSLSEIQWSVPGNKIGGYVANSSTGTVTPLGTLQDNTLTFYWVDGGDGRQVTVSCTVNGLHFNKTATFNVKRPTAQVSITTSSTNIDTDSQSGITELRLGNPDTTPGLTFTRTVSIPSGFNGSTQWVQVFTKKSASLMDFNAQVTTLNKAGLDDAYPYPLDAGATSANLKTSDTPALFLDGFVSGSVDFEATMWLLFRPTVGTNPIWVPLRQVSWVWTANATSDGTTWTINSHSDPTNLSDSNSTSHPQWTTNAN